MKKMVKYCILIIVGVLVQTVSAVSWDGVMQGLTPDRAAYSNENDSASVVLRSTTAVAMELGQDGYSNLFEPFFVFQLPNVGMEDAPFVSVNFSAELLYNCAIYCGFAADLYGSEPRDTADVLASDYYMGANDTSPTFTKIKDTWINFNVDPGVPSGTKTFAQEEILNYINDVYEGGTNAGKYIVIRISMNAPGYGWKQASFASANSETESFRPKISYTAARNLVSGKVIADHNDVNIYVNTNAAPCVGGGTLENTSSTKMTMPLSYNSGSQDLVRNIVFPFQIPDFGIVDNPFKSASFSLDISDASGGWKYYGMDLFALSVRESSEVLGSDFYAGGSVDAPESDTLIDGGFIISGTTAPATGVRSIDTVGKENLKAYLNTVYDGGNGVGKFVFLRLNPYNRPSFTWGGIRIASSEYAVEASRPTISYEAHTADPPPSGTLIIVQ